jgi:signal peptidase
MRPLVRDGDILTAEPVGTRSLRLGDIALHGTNEGRTAAHRVIAHRTQQGRTVLITCGDGSARSIARVSQEQLLGKVVTAQRGEKVVRLDRGMRRAIGLLWVAISHVRYLVLRLTNRLRRVFGARKTAVAEEHVPARAAASPSPGDRAHVGQALISLCGAFACGAGWPVPPDFAPGDWEQLAKLAGRHGLTPVLYRSLNDAHAVPPDVGGTLKKHYILQTARNMFALRQLDEIAQALQDTPVDVIVLKGATALVQLYDDAGCRTMVDIDFMVQRESVDAFRQLLSTLGYRCPMATAPESMWVTTEMGYRFPFERQGSLMLDVHTDILDTRDATGTATDEMWTQARPLRPGGALRALAPAHFLLHAAAHYGKHREFDAPALSWMLDALLAVRKWGAGIDWPAFWETADRWGTGGDAATIMATLSRHWGLHVPSLPADAEPLSAGSLVSTESADSTRQAAATLARHRRRITKMRQLPTMGARLHYLRFLVLPPAPVLRSRYGVPQGKAVGPYYIRHLLTLAGKFFRGIAATVWRPRR